jgi:hypothetical protein
MRGGGKGLGRGGYLPEMGMMVSCSPWMMRTGQLKEERRDVDKSKSD